MTINELIKELEKYDGSLPIYVWDSENVPVTGVSLYLSNQNQPHGKDNPLSIDMGY